MATNGKLRVIGDVQDVGGEVHLLDHPMLGQEEDSFIKLCRDVLAQGEVHVKAIVANLGHVEFLDNMDSMIILDFNRKRFFNFFIHLEHDQN